MIKKTYPIIEQLIINALKMTEQLHQELNREADALKKNPQAALISDLAANKKQLIEQLEQFNTQLTQILATEKLPNNQNSIREYFKRAETACLSTAESTSNWAQLMRVCFE